MKRLLSVGLLLALLSVAGHAQAVVKSEKAKPKPEQSAPPRPTQEQQKAFAQAQAEADRALIELKAAAARADKLDADAPVQYRLQALLEVAEAKARHDLKAQAVLTTVYYVMAQLKISPEEFEPRVSQGALVFTLKPAASP